MSYRIHTSSMEGSAYYTLESIESGEYVIILPDHGGTVYQIALCPQGKEGARVKKGAAQRAGLRELLESDSPEEIQKNPWFRGRILFPFDDRVHKGVYSFQGRRYQLPINDPDGQDALHGFLYAQPLNVTFSEGTSEEAKLVLEGDVTDKPGYPFYLHIRLEYRLYPRGFQMKLKVENRGDGAAPFSVGWHPYFKAAEPKSPPSALSETGTGRKQSDQEQVDRKQSDRGEGDSPTGAADKMELVLPAEHYIETDEKQVPSGMMLPVRDTELDFRGGRPIGKLKIDHGFTNPAGFMECRNGGQTLRIEQSELFRYSQVFVPPDRNSVALEPISGATDAFNHPQLGLRILEPGKSVDGMVRVCLLDGVGQHM